MSDHTRHMNPEQSLFDLLSTAHPPSVVDRMAGITDPEAAKRVAQQAKVRETMEALMEETARRVLKQAPSPAMSQPLGLINFYRPSYGAESINIAIPDFSE